MRFSPLQKRVQQRKKDLAAFGSFRTRDWILAYRKRIDGGVLSHDVFNQANLA